MSQNRLILASASPRRKKLLEQIGITPSLVIPAMIDETPHKAERPSEFAKRMAIAKASHIANLNKNEYILAADTVVAIGRTIFPKAETKDDVYKFITRLGGRNHRVYGGICLIQPGGRVWKRLVETRVFMRRLSNDELTSYADCDDWRGKAGGYAIQGRAAQYIKQINGSYSNVVGLDLYTTSKLLRGVGFYHG